MPFIRVLINGAPRDEVRINGRFAYTTEHMPLKEGHAKTEAYVDGRRRRNDRF